MEPQNEMNLARLAIILIAAGVLTAGCDSDKSGETQSMPKSASAPNESPKMPSGLSPKAQDAIKKAAPVGN